MIVTKYFLIYLVHSNVLPVKVGKYLSDLKIEIIYIWWRDCIGLVWGEILSFLTNVGTAEAIPLHFSEFIKDISNSDIKDLSI